MHAARWSLWLVYSPAVTLLFCMCESCEPKTWLPVNCWQWMCSWIPAECRVWLVDVRLPFFLSTLGAGWSSCTCCRAAKTTEPLARQVAVFTLQRGRLVGDTLWHLSLVAQLLFLLWRCHSDLRSFRQSHRGFLTRAPSLGDVFVLSYFIVTPIAASPSSSFRLQRQSLLKSD